jgi:cation transport ATPase
MKVQYAEMRNRQLKVINHKEYDVSLIEKGDVLKVIAGRVLVDLIVIQGSVKAVQSARTGSDKLIHLKKGDRLESGALVYETVDDCLAEV